MAILLPVHLLALGLAQWEVGLISSATLLGSALASLAIGNGDIAFHCASYGWSPCNSVFVGPAADWYGSHWRLCSSRIVPCINRWYLLLTRGTPAT